jgi:hypothetical protein
VQAVDENLTKAKALGNALLVFLLVPWTLCLIFYTGESPQFISHWSSGCASVSACECLSINLHKHDLVQVCITHTHGTGNALPD